MDEQERRLSQILQEAGEGEGASVGFYADLKYTVVDDTYLENLIQSIKKKKCLKMVKYVSAISMIVIPIMIVFKITYRSRTG